MNDRHEHSCMPIFSMTEYVTTAFSKFFLATSFLVHSNDSSAKNAEKR